MKNIHHYQTAIGRVCIADNGVAITNVCLPGEEAPEGLDIETALIGQAAEQLEQYLSGERKTFTVPLAPEGGGFMLRVWECLRTIPYGETRSYGQIAALVGNPGAARAVGQANNRNPIAILIPCHRVIGSDGRLIGYAAGLDIEEKLLELERRNG